MTPLELLAVGVIVVVTWWAGFFAAENSERKADFGFWPVVVLLLGCGSVASALISIFLLGIKEAAK